jgi:hypothetical protein
MTAPVSPPLVNLLEDSMSTYRPWYLSVTAFLLVAGPVSALAQEEGQVKMIYAVWSNQTAAENTLKHMNTAAKDQMEAYAILTKDKAGKIDVTQRYHKSRGSSTGLQASETLDRAIAQLSTPDTGSVDSASGYAAQASRLSEKDLKKVVEMFDPGESALLLLSPKPAVADIQRAIGMGAQGHPEVVVLEVK